MKISPFEVLGEKSPAALYGFVWSLAQAQKESHFPISL